MVALSPRFTALAVLCSVAAFTLPHADAAVMGVRPAVVRATHDDPAYATPPAYGAGSTMSKRFGGSHDSMFATEAIWNARFARRPLSGMAGIPFDDQKNGNLPRQGYHGKVARSVYIEGKAGESYVVKPARRSLSQQHFNGAEWRRQDHSIEWKRQEVTGVPGTIDIMSPTADPSSPLQRIASLVLAQANSTGSTNGTFVLNASPDDQTQMFLVPMANTTMGFLNSTQDIPVMLQVPVFDAASAATQAWCATFDPAPLAPVSMTAEKCLDPGENGMNGDHMSQVFAFNSVTGAVRPLWANGTNSDAVDDTDGVPTAQQAAYVDPQTPDDASIASVTDFEAPIRRQEAQAPFASSSSSAASSTTSPASTSSVTSAASSTGVPASDFSSGSFGGSAALDVTLVFVPSEPQINAIAAQDIPTSSASSSAMSATQSASDASVAPSATLNSTAYPTMGSSSTETTMSTAVAFADAAVGPSSFSSSAASTSAMTTSTSAGASSYSVASTSISDSAAPRPTVPSFRPLNVQVVPEAFDADATPTLALPQSSGTSASASATASAAGSASSSASSASPSVIARSEDQAATPPYTWLFKRDD
ncbi:unnamed protein product [Peniophora sp. CBMAI 1063]|nr:unnamed protein product [Peniophora sp. CBMAI 1063]